MYERTTANNVNVNGAATSTYEQANSSIDTRSSAFLGKVYGYMAILILITTAVALGVGYGLYYGVLSALDAGDTDLAGRLLYIGIAGMVVSAIAMLVCSLIISIASFRRKMSIVVPGIIYAVSFGVLMSFTVLIANELEPWILPSAFGITAMAFAIMFLITRRAQNLNWLAVLGLTLLTGALLLGLVFGLVYLFNTVVGLHFMSEGAYLLFVILDAVVFLAMILLITYDIWRISKIADHGAYSKNLAQYCAFWLYQDFMYLLIRIMRILIYVAAHMKK